MIAPEVYINKVAVFVLESMEHQRLISTAPELDPPLLELQETKSRTRRLRISPPSLRPRLVVSLSAPDKYGLAFCMGALEALRRLQILRHTRVVATSGLATVAAAFMSRYPWLQLSHHGNDFQDSLLLEVAESVKQFCLENQEWDMFVSRTFHVSRWLDSWGEELCEVLNSKYKIPHLTPFAEKHEPWYLYGIQQPTEPTSFYASNDSQAINMLGIPVRIYSRDEIPDLNRIVAAAIQPPGRFTGGVPLTICHKVQSQRLNVPVHSVVQTTVDFHASMYMDPLNYNVADVAMFSLRLFQSRTDDDKKQSDKSKKLVLIDACTGAEAFSHNKAISAASKLAATRTHAIATGGPNVDDEQIIAFRSRTVRMYDTITRGDLLGSTPSMYATSYTAFESDLRELCSADYGFAQLTSANEDMVNACMNIGLFQTYAAFDSGRTVPEPVAPEYDPWNLQIHYFHHRR